VKYASHDYWDGYFSDLNGAGQDLDWAGQWTEPFLDRLKAQGAERLLDLGCGTGADVVRLVEAGFDVTGLDFSRVALERARARVGERAKLVAADLAAGLPFADESFDAVMANVALHMFPDRITRRVFNDVWRVTRPRGLFVFHVNATEDRELRERRRPVVREIEPNYVLEQAGQTVRFFSRDYLVELLSAWRELELELVEITDPTTAEPFKRVWRGVAQR
jgi:ubiquinone/menaquinone biosynthesis C-methylase UbiE